MIVEFKSFMKRKVRGTNIELGQTLFAVAKNDYFFYWCYSDKATAEAIDRKLTGPTSQVDREANWRRDLRELRPTDTKIETKSVSEKRPEDPAGYPKP